MANNDDLTPDVLAKLAEHKIDLTEEERGQIAAAERAYRAECYVWYPREGANWIYYSIAIRPESYYWDEFPASVRDRCGEELLEALRDRVEAYKHTLTERWQFADAQQNAAGGAE